MPAERGIFLDVLPRFDMAAMGAILTGVENMFRKSGAAMGASFGKEAEARIGALAEAERKSANVTEDAELRKSRAIHATEIAEQQASLATDRRVLAMERANALLNSSTASEDAKAAAALRVEAATIAETRASYAASDAMLAQTARARDLATAQGLSAKAADAHAEAVAASAVTAGNAGRAFNVAGLALTGGFVVGAVEATKKAGDFQQAMVKLTASAGESKGNIQVVSDGILQLAGQVGISAQDLANSMFLVEKAGYRGGDGLKVLTAASQLANAEGADLNDTIQGLTTSMHDFGYGVDQAATVASKMNVAAGDSKAPLQEFSSALHNVEPVAAMAKIRLEEVYAAMARITQSGAGADQGSEWLNNTVTHLMNMNQQQKDFLSQIGMDPVGLQQDLGNKDIGMTGVITEISNKIKSQLNPQQQLVLDTQYKSVQAVQSLNKEYSLLSPKAKELADKMKAGNVGPKDLQAIRVAKVNDPNLAAFQAQLMKLEGVNSQLKKGQGDLIGVAAAFAKAFGTDSGLKVVSLLAGTPEQAKAMSDELKKLDKTTQEADGTVKGFNETQATLVKKLADAKAGFGSAVIQLGNDFIPVMTSVTNGLKDVAQWMAANKGVAETLMGVMGAFTVVWLGFKAAAGTVGMWNTISTGLGWMLTKLGLVKVAAAEAATATGSIGTAAVVAEGEVVGAQATETTAIEATGGAAVTTAGEVRAIGSAALGALTAAGLTVAAPTAIGNAAANKIQGTDHPWYWAIEKGFESPFGGFSSAWDRTFHPGENQLPVQAQNKGMDRGAANPERRAGMPGHDSGPAEDPLAALNAALGSPANPDNTVPMPGDNSPGAAAGGGAAAGAPPVGDRNDPIFIDPSSITDGLNDSDMGADGSVGGGLMNIFTSAGSGGFTLPNLAKLMGTFVANLALGNPAGKLATGNFGGDTGGDLTQSISDIENMTPAQRIEEQNTIKMRKAISSYKKALRSYAKAVQKHGAGSDEALDAEDSVLSAKDNIASAEIGMQQKGGRAAQTLADDDAKGVATSNPGKYARDQAAASAYGGSGGYSPAVGYSDPNQNGRAGGPGAEKWRGTVSDVFDQYAGKAGIPASKKQEWVDSIVSQIGTESQGNANASNKNDPNGRGGTQDVEGLLQYLPSTYANSGGALTGLPYMSPEGQIAGALLAPRTAAGDPSNSGTGIGHGHGWGPNAYTGGGGRSPVLKKSPGGIGDIGGDDAAAKYGRKAPGYGLEWNPKVGWVQSNNAVPGVPLNAAAGAVAGVQPKVNGGTPGASGVGQQATAGVQSSQPKGGTGKGGVGLSSGAMSMISSAAAAAFPGAGAAAQIGLEEANRAAQFGGQAIGIGMQGLMETFSLHGADGAGGNGGWLGKVAGGLAGAHKSADNQAGAAKPLTPEKGTPASGQGNGPPPGPMVHIENQNVNHGDSQAQNADMVRQLAASPAFTAP